MRTKCELPYQWRNHFINGVVMSGWKWVWKWWAFDDGYIRVPHKICNVPYSVGIFSDRCDNRVKVNLDQLMYSQQRCILNSHSSPKHAWIKDCVNYRMYAPLKLFKKFFFPKKNFYPATNERMPAVHLS